MRRPVLLIFVNAMILIVVFALMTQSLVIMQRIARAERVTGSVEVQRSGKGGWKELSTGGLIKTGDVVRSGGDGVAEFRWADGTRWKIMPETEISVKKSSYNVVKKADQSQLKLTTGKVFIRIMKSLKSASKFEVETPTAVAAVRGTIFSVEVKEGKTSVEVWKGEVKVSSDGVGVRQEDTVIPGESATSAAPGELRAVKSACSDFKDQPTIVQPDLDAEMQSLKKDRIMIRGTTEAGNNLTINGKKVRVLGNGSFLYRAPGKSALAYTIVSTDKHGSSATRVLRAP